MAQGEMARGGLGEGRGVAGCSWGQGSTMWTVADYGRHR